MKIRVNLDIIRRLLPCEGRLANYVQHYPEFDGDILEFLKLTRITPSDKIWVFCHLAPVDLVRIFAMDCALLLTFISEITWPVDQAEDLAESASKSASASILSRTIRSVAIASIRASDRLSYAYVAMPDKTKWLDRELLGQDLYRSNNTIETIKYLVSTTTKKGLACLA